MARVYLNQTNDDLQTLIAGQDPRAQAILTDVLAVATTSRRVLERTNKRAAVAAQAAGETSPRADTPFFEYMALVALRSCDMTPDRLIAFHETVGKNDPVRTAAAAVHAFTSNSPHLGEDLRKAQQGRTDYHNPDQALRDLQVRYGFFGRRGKKAGVAGPTEAMAEVAATRTLPVVAPVEPTRSFGIIGGHTVTDYRPHPSRPHKQRHPSAEPAGAV